MRIAADTSTYPEAGVIATSPATAPAAAPSTLGAPLCSQDTVIQVSAAMAAAVFVTTNALAARPPALIALPALKPNQPNQSSDAPRTVMVASCGSIGSRPRPLRRPSTSAATSAETPLVMCTTVPPAKSSVPSILSHPPVPQTQCATGSYTNVAQRSVNTTNALKRLRSANAPVMSAGVMTANIIWKTMYASCGTVGAYGPGSWPTPLSAAQSRPPMTPPISGPNASV